MLKVAVFDTATPPTHSGDHPSPTAHTWPHAHPAMLDLATTLDPAATDPWARLVREREKKERASGLSQGTRATVSCKEREERPTCGPFLEVREWEKKNKEEGTIWAELGLFVESAHQLKP